MTILAALMSLSAVVILKRFNVGMKATAYLSVVFVILVWGMTFANTRALLEDFSALEIQLLRFSLAWASLSVWEMVSRIVRRPQGGSHADAGNGAWRNRDVGRRCRDELLFAGMGLTGVAAYQFLENCAIYYTNASNVAILVSFGPIVTAVMARLMANDRTLSVPFVAGSLIAVCGVALVSLNGVVNFNVRPLGDFMALGAMACWGFYSVLVDTANKRGIPQTVAVRKAFFWALVLMAPVALWGLTDDGYYALDGSFSVTLDADFNAERFARPLNLVNIAFLGALASAACFVLWNCACKSIGMVRTTIGLYLTPIVGTVFAMLFLGENLTVMGASGGGVIIVGVAVSNIRSWRRSGK